MRSEDGYVASEECYGAEGHVGERSVPCWWLLRRPVQYRLEVPYIIVVYTMRDARG